MLVSGEIIAAIIGGAVLISATIGSLIYKENTKAKEEAKFVAKTVLYPLRFYLAETHIRLCQIGHGKLERAGFESIIDSLRVIKEPEELELKNDKWFINDGAYLSSTVYVTACLLYYLEYLKKKLPNLRKPNERDYTIIDKTLRVTIALKSNHGVYNTVQNAVSERMARSDLDSQDVIGYPDFCKLLVDSRESIWFHRLIFAYIRMDDPLKVKALKEFHFAIEVLADEVDKFLDSSNSLEKRRKVEGISMPDWNQVGI